MSAEPTSNKHKPCWAILRGDMDGRKQTPFQRREGTKGKADRVVTGN